MIRKVMIITVALALFAGVAQADIIKYFEFNNDGVLPSDDPEIFYFGTSPEADVFSVSGGTMTGIHPDPSGQAAFYAYPNANSGGSQIVGGEIDRLQPWVYEARVRVLYHSGHHYGHGVGGFLLWTGNKRFNIYHTPTGVRVDHGGIPNYTDYPMDISQWHVIRMEGLGSLFTASVDGVIIANNYPGITDGGNGFYIDLKPIGGGAQVEWDYIRFEAGPMAVPTESQIFGSVKALYR